MKTKNKLIKAKVNPRPFYPTAEMEYVWFCYVDLKDGQGPTWHRTDFREDSVEKANRWKTNKAASDVFNKPTILVRKSVSWQVLTPEQYATLSMSGAQRLEKDLVEWGNRKCIFGKATQKLCTPSRYFDCLQCRR